MGRQNVEKLKTVRLHIQTVLSTLQGGLKPMNVLLRYILFASLVLLCINRSKTLKSRNRLYTGEAQATSSGEDKGQ